MEKLDITSLKNAVIRLDESILCYQSDITDLQICDGLIQCFEFTYELSHKMLNDIWNSYRQIQWNLTQ